jgi:GntR family transcriptional regulator
MIGMVNLASQVLDSGEIATCNSAMRYEGVGVSSEKILSIRRHGSGVRFQPGGKELLNLSAYVTDSRRSVRLSRNLNRAVLFYEVIGRRVTYPSVVAGHKATTILVMSLDDRSARINHDSATTVTAQVAADIEADIDAGRLSHDTRMPSEVELSAQYGVSRVTVRRAIQQLRERGKLVTVHGRGTYVARHDSMHPDQGNG